MGAAKARELQAKSAARAARKAAEIKAAKLKDCKDKYDGHAKDRKIDSLAKKVLKHSKTTAKHAKSKSARKHASKTVASAKKLVKLTHGMKPNRVLCRKVNGKKVCKMVFPKNKKVYKERAAKARAKYK